MTRRRMPATANAWYWSNPDQWEPGIPIYDSFHDSASWQRNFLVCERAMEHSGCEGESCDGSDKAMVWRYIPNWVDWGWLREFEADPYATPTFYGAGFVCPARMVDA
jgi:hypothetical protein